MKEALRTTGVDDDYALKDFAVTKLSRHRTVAETTALYKMHTQLSSSPESPGTLSSGQVEPRRGAATSHAVSPSGLRPGGTTPRCCHQPRRVPLRADTPASSGASSGVREEHGETSLLLLLLETSHQGEDTPQEEKRPNEPLLSRDRRLKLTDFRHTTEQSSVRLSVATGHSGSVIHVYEACIF